MMLAGFVLGGVVLGNSHRVELTRLAAWMLRASVLFSLVRLTFWPFGHIAWHIYLVGAVPVAVGYAFGRAWCHFFTGEWWIPFVVSILAPLLVLSLINPNTKQGWPWRSFQPQILALQVNADAAFNRLHLARDRDLTALEMESLAKETPLKLTLRFPLTGWRVYAAVMQGGRLVGDGYVSMWWGGDTFGPVDPRTMTVLWASD